MSVNPRKVLTPGEMGEVDRATIAAGIPGIILMENAAARVVEYIAARFAPVANQQIVLVCGKGNNGGDGLAIARQLHARFAPRSLWVVLTCDPEELRADAALNLTMLRAAGVQEFRDFGPEMRTATLVIDAVLGTGLEGAAKGVALGAIHGNQRGVPDGEGSCGGYSIGPFGRERRSAWRLCARRCHRDIHGAKGLPRNAAGVQPHG